VVASSRPVGQILALRDDPLEAHAASVPKHRRAVFVVVLAVAEWGAGRQARGDRGEQRLTVEQERAGEVEAVEVEQVEDVITHAISATGFQVSLQVAEVRDALLVFGHHLAVEQRRANLERLEPRRDRREALRPVEGLARQQADVAAVNAGLDTVAVEFELVDPLGAARRLIGEERETRLDESGESAGAGPFGHCPGARPDRFSITFRRRSGDS
jgi:hypothetical protein